MDKERVKQELRKKYTLSFSDMIMVNVMLDAIELSREDGQVLVTHPVVGSMIVCPSCNGKSCTACDGGMIRVISNTPSA